MGRGRFKIDTSDVIGMLIKEVEKLCPKGARVVSWEYVGELSDVTLFVDHPSIPDGATVINPMLGTAFIVERPRGVITNEELSELVKSEESNG